MINEPSYVGEWKNIYLSDAMAFEIGGTCGELVLS